MDWALLSLSFVSIFWAELADRSSLATFALSGNSKHPRAVFFGALLALIAANLLGAIVGEELSKLLPLQLVKILAVLGFFYLAIHSLWLERSAFKKPDRKAPDPEAPDQSTEETVQETATFPKKLAYKPYGSGWSVFSTTFVSIFLASLGDQEQMVTLLLSAQSRSPWLVFLGATFAVIATSLVAVGLGQVMGRWLSPRILKIACGVILLLVAIWLLVGLVHGGDFELLDLFEHEPK